MTHVTDKSIIVENTIPTKYFVTRKPILVLMGVCGCGKSTIAEHISNSCNLPYAEADDFHPQSNIDKMSAGIPLTDQDRLPWLNSIANWIDERITNNQSAIVTCSALKKEYRDILRRPEVVFVYMQGSYEEVMERLSQRKDHFMKPNMLQSQFDILQEPTQDELHVNVHIGNATPDQEAAAVISLLPLLDQKGE